MSDKHEGVPAVNNRFISQCCQGEFCKCGKPAEHKVGETIFFDDPNPVRHELTAYVCHDCFTMFMTRGKSDYPGNVSPLNPIPIPSLLPLPPDTKEGDKIFTEFYLQVCKEQSRRQHRQLMERVYLGNKR